MGAEPERTLRETLEAIYRDEGPRVLSTLIRLLGDFDLAEEATHEAFAAAVERWPKDGVPAHPRAWLVSTGRFKTIDALRRDTRLFASLRAAADRPGTEWEGGAPCDESAVEDDRLRLVFACCHPSLPREGRVALTLREVCGLTTEEIARAFLVSTPTVAQRIVRAKGKIREERIPFELPARDELAERTQGVLQTVYLLFNEGYYASSGESLTRHVLSDEAIRLGRLLVELLPAPETFGLLALMLVHESRRAARTSATGEIVLLADQDRSLWDGALLDEGLSLGARALESPTPGPYALQAGIAAAHVRGARAGTTDWSRIVGLYDSMLALGPSAVVELNRAVAVSMRDGPLAGLLLVDELLAGGELDGYALVHATQADLYRRLGRMEEASQAYVRALELTTQGAERRFLQRRLREVSGPLKS